MFYDFIYLAKGFRMRPKVRSSLTKTKIKIWGFKSLKGVLTLNFEMDLRLPRNKQFNTRTLRVLEFSTGAMITPKTLLSNLFEFQYSVV